MKKSIILFSFIALLTGCIDFDDATQPISLKVQVEMPQQLSGAELAGHNVIISLGNKTITAQTDASGMATFQNIVPDVYDISTSWKMTAQEYAALTGESVQNGKYTVSGSITSKMLSSEQTLTLSTNVSRDQSMLISKVYYAGSKDINNKNYTAGKYI